MQQSNAEASAHQLHAELNQLKEQKRRLEEENKALKTRANGIQVLSKLYDQSRSEAAELKRKLMELTDDKKRWDDSSREAFLGGGARSSGSGLENSNDAPEESLDCPPWNANDAQALDEVMLELKFLLDKNKELTRELEEALKDTAKLDGDDEVFVEHLNCLKVELDLYNYRLQGQGDWPRKLRDEAQRLKTKLTDIAAHRGRTCGRLQDEIDFVKKKLFDIELRIKPKIAGEDESKSETETGTMATRPRGLDVVGEGDVFDLAELQSTEEVGSGARPRNLDQTRKMMEKDEETPVAKSKEDLNKGELASLMAKIVELEQEITKLNAENGELIKVNHEWDAQYRTLNDFFRSEVRSRDESFHKLQRQLSQEHHKVHGSVKELLDQKDSVIEEQSTKIRQLKDELARVTLESSQVLMRRIESDTEKKYQHAKRMFHELKKDNDIMKRREEAALQEKSILKDAVEVLETESKSLNSRNKMLETEIERLTKMLEFFSGSRTITSPPSLAFQESPGMVRQLEEEHIEVLKQQISVYIEDFNTEKQEKEKLAEEVRILKGKLREAQKEILDCKKKMKIYENDLNMEKKEKQREASAMHEFEEGASYTRKPMSQRMEYSNDEARMAEYYHLSREKSRILDRMKELEYFDRFPQPDRFLDMGYAARGSAQLQAPIEPRTQKKAADKDIFFGGQVVRDGDTTKESCTKCNPIFRARVGPLSSPK